MASSRKAHVLFYLAFLALLDISARVEGAPTAAPVTNPLLPQLNFKIPTPAPVLKGTPKPTPRPSPAPTKKPTPVTEDDDNTDDDGSQEATSGSAGAAGGTLPKVKKTFAPTPVYLIPRNGTEEEEDSSANEENMHWSPLIYAAVATGLAVVLLLTVGIVVRIVKSPAMSSPVLSDSSPSVGPTPHSHNSQASSRPPTVRTSRSTQSKASTPGHVAFTSPLEFSGASALSQQQPVSCISQADSTVDDLRVSGAGGGGGGGDGDSFLDNSASKLEAAVLQTASVVPEDEAFMPIPTSPPLLAPPQPTVATTTAEAWGLGVMTGTIKDLFTSPVAVPPAPVTDEVVTVPQELQQQQQQREQEQGREAATVDSAPPGEEVGGRRENVAKEIDHDTDGLMSTPLSSAPMLAQESITVDLTDDSITRRDIALS